MTRRQALIVSAAAFLPWNRLLAGEFWDKKDPSQWTTEEIEKLTTNSPWAKQVTAQYVRDASDEGRGRGQGGGGQYPGGGYPGGGGGRPQIGLGIPGIGMPRGRGRGGYPGGGYPGGGRGAGPQYKGTVRWESAQPIREAMKLDLPEELANHYVIGIRDFPILPNRRRSEDDEPQSEAADQKETKALIDRLKRETTLQPKGREMVEPRVVVQPNPGTSQILFGFAKSSIQLTKNDHEVDFTTHLPSLTIKAKFDPYNMIYKKQLAL